MTAALRPRTASDNGDRVTYRGVVRGLVVGDEEIDEVKGAKTYQFDGGHRDANKGGAGLDRRRSRRRRRHPAGTRDRGRRRVRDGHGGAGRRRRSRPRPRPPTPHPSRAPTRADRHPSAAQASRLATPADAHSFVFPVGGRTTIGGPFGAFRASTGEHQGNDLFADFGTPVVAVADGELANVGTLPISGNRLWVYADSGDQFFYAHLSAFSPAAVNGRHVEAGTVLGYVGNTGDAEPTPPHVHFEIHPERRRRRGPQSLPRRPGRSVPARRSADTAERPGALVEVRDFIEER